MSNPRFVGRVTAFAIALAVVGCATVSAQTAPGVEPSARPNWYVYAGVAPSESLNDAAASRALYGEFGEVTTSGHFVLEAGVRITKRVSVGVEIFPASSLTSLVAGAKSVEYTFFQNERTVGFVLHATALESRWAGLEAVVGPSITWSDGGMTANIPGIDTSAAATSLQPVGLLAGFDVPLRPIARLALVPHFRVLMSPHLYIDGFQHTSEFATQAMLGFGVRVLL